MRKLYLSAAFIVPSISATIAPLLFAISDANAVGFEVIVPHRAIYEIKLNEASERSGISNLNGRIIYEINGNECDGVSIKYRFVNRVSTPRKSFVTDQRTSTFESADGNDFNFLTKSFLNDQLERIVRGTAKQKTDNVEISLAQPKIRDLKINKAKFLSSYIMNLITRAKAGDKFVRGDIFDGSGEGDDAVTTSTIVGAAKVYDKQLEGEAENIAENFADQSAWPVAMSYFAKDVGATAEHLPVYESSFLLYENGITRRLIMRYPDYSLKGNLVELEYLDNPVCQKDG